MYLYFAIRVRSTSLRSCLLAAARMLFGGDGEEHGYKVKMASEYYWLYILNILSLSYIRFTSYDRCLVAVQC